MTSKRERERGRERERELMNGMEGPQGGRDRGRDLRVGGTGGDRELTEGELEGADGGRASLSVALGSSHRVH